MYRWILRLLYVVGISARGFLGVHAAAGFRTLITCRYENALGGVEVLKCYMSESPPLAPKGIGMVFGCVGVNISVTDPISDTKEALGRILREYLDVPGLSVEFTENEAIGTNYMLYKYHVLTEGRFLCSCRAVLRGSTVEEIVCSFDRFREVRLVRGLPAGMSEPELPAKPPARGAPPGQFYIDHFIVYRILGTPKVDPRTWRLRVGGLVENPLELSLEDIDRLPKVVIVRDFHCVTGWSVANVRWEGVSLKLIAKMARPLSNARWVVAAGLDGYSSTIPLDDFISDEALLALKMGDKPLSIEQGFPARIVIPHLYGWKGVKWVTQIIFTDRYIDGYWEALGYHERGYVYLEERFKSSRNIQHQP